MTANEHTYYEDQKGDRKMECDKAVDPVFYWAIMRRDVRGCELGRRSTGRRGGSSSVARTSEKLTRFFLRSVASSPPLKPVLKPVQWRWPP